MTKSKKETMRGFYTERHDFENNCEVIEKKIKTVTINWYNKQGQCFRISVQNDKLNINTHWGTLKILPCAANSINLEQAD